tara:strand:+ start:43 stop:327 length:285 start_codon:yes stop_codon:yes gene_type:complete
MRIIAYTYDADYHCIDCTREQFRQPLALDLDIDEHGIGMEIEDSEGNFVHPLFCIDEWQELDEWYLAENPTQYLACGDCHEIIDTYTVESEVTA